LQTYAGVMASVLGTGTSDEQEALTTCVGRLGPRAEKLSDVAGEVAAGQPATRGGQAHWAQTEWANREPGLLNAGA
jgi:hypothetical protein